MAPLRNRRRTLVSTAIISYARPRRATSTLRLALGHADRADPAHAGTRLQLSRAPCPSSTPRAIPPSLPASIESTGSTPPLLPACEYRAARRRAASTYSVVRAQPARALRVVACTRRRQRRAWRPPASARVI